MMEPLTTYDSVKIKRISFLMIFFVMIGHSVYIESQSFDVANVVQGFVSYCFSCTSTPTFFFISGLLFFCRVADVKDCYPKIFRRFRTLLIPYILWNLIFVLWYVVLECIPFCSSFVNDSIYRNFPSLTDGLYFLFVKPASFHLWFLRDLIVFVILSPILYYLIKKCGWYLFAILLLVAPLAVEVLHFSHFELPFFVLGGTVAVKGCLRKAGQIPTSVVCSAFGCKIILSLIWALFWPKVFVGSEWLRLFMRVLGVIYIWKGYDILIGKLEHLLPTWFSTMVNYTFFIYLFHEPAFNIIKKLPLRIFGVNDFTLIFFYLVNPFLMLIFAVCVAKMLQRICPSVYTILVGGRK